MRRSFLLVLILLLVLSFGCSDKEEQPSETIVPAEIEEQEEIEEEDLGPEPLVKAEKELPGAFMVSIDNHPKANPQSGLDKADRVYEMLAEGGITRYLAVFHSRGCEKIGPVRSARYYFAEIAKGHDFPLAHAGGSTDALSLIKKLKVKDLDEIYNSGSYFWRTKDRKMPHNLYTSTEQLLKGAKVKKYELLPLKPLPQGTVTGGKPVDLIEITYSNQPNFSYAVTYEWDGERYKRYINGKPHVSLEGGEIVTENVIVLAAKTRQYAQNNEPKTDIDIIGSGQALYFTKGQGFEGTWEKKKANTEIEFFYEGKPMEFVGEHAWINIVPNLDTVKMTEPEVLIN